MSNPPVAASRRWSLPPAELLDPPDVDGLMAWIRRESGRQAEERFICDNEAVAASREQVAAVLRRVGPREGAARRTFGRKELWRPLLHPRLRSHRRVVGPLIVWCKRYLIRPLISWHIEFTEENVRHQASVNQSLVALVEHLCARIIVLEQHVETLERRAAERGGTAPGERR